MKGNTENENKDLFKFCKILMIIGGIWSKGIESSSTFKQKLYKFYSIGGQMYYLSCVVLITVELYKVAGVDMEATTANLKSLTFVSTIIAKMFLCQTTKIVKLINSALEEERSIIKSNVRFTQIIYFSHVKYCRRMVTFLIAFLYFAGVIYLGETFYESYRYHQDYDHWLKINKTVAENIAKPHPVQFWFPFDKDKYYTLSVTYECIHITQSVLFNGAAQSLVNTAMVFLTAELKILQQYINHYDAYPVLDQFLEIQDISKRTLKVIVMKHDKIIRWTNDFNDSFQYILLLEYCVISLLLATTLLELYQGEKIPFNTFFFILCTLQLFILAWNANEIVTESSSGLLDAIYTSNWYLEQTKESKVFVQLMMTRCFKPLAISIGPFGSMTMNAALSRMKLAYSVLSLLSSQS